MPIIVHYITNIAPLYRKNLWERILKSKITKTYFFYGSGKSGIKEINVNTDFEHHINSFKKVKNIWFRNKILIWQKGIVMHSLKTKPDAAILLGEFTILSNWLITLIYKIKKVPLVIYGHGMYGNEKGLKLFFRKYYLCLADKHLVYGLHAKNVMVNSGLNPKSIYVFYNSLDYDNQLAQRKILTTNTTKSKNLFSDNSLPTIIFIGRLTKEKKLHYLIHLAKRLYSETPINLLFIGKGEMMQSLQESASQQLNSGNFHFYGSCYDEEILGELLFHADLCISPGNVGLTAIHALTYGTPVATHSNQFEQGPEVEAIKEGSTGFFFEQNNLEDLTLKTKTWLTNAKNHRNDIREACFKVIDTTYNPSYQLEIYNRLIKDIINKH